MEATGACEFFRIQPFLDAANILVAADEPLRALQLLDNLPGFYRDNIPVEVFELKTKIQAALATPTFYQKDFVERDWDMQQMAEQASALVDGLVRGQQVLKDVQEYNKQNITPHLIDLGPGEYWLPIGLLAKRCLFTYQDIGLCWQYRDKAKKYLEQIYCETVPQDRPVIFVACELIEHLHYEADIAVEFHKIKANAEIIHLSTPLYTFDGRANQLDWWAEKKAALGHLRTYTPKDFWNVVTTQFPTYEWELTRSQIMHLRGARSGRLPKV